MSWALAGALLVSPARASEGGEAAAAELQVAWRCYARTFIRGGRVIDPSRDRSTTSEGQAYAMLRALWMGDEARFDTIRGWTLAELQGGERDQLPAWLWGRKGWLRRGVQDPSPASDADILIAWSLLLAAERWERPALTTEARALLREVWERETLEVAGTRVLLPGPWAKEGALIRVNPSYFLPFALRTFVSADPDHDWGRLLDDSYVLMDRLIGPAGLPPDWAWLDRSTGLPVAPPADAQATSVVSFDALRVPWNIEADARWSGDPRATALLLRMEPLAQRYTAEGMLPARMTVEGAPLETWPYPGLYAALLPTWRARAPEAAARVWEQTLAPLWADQLACDGQHDYFAANWLWFGVALADSPPGSLPGAS